MAAIHVELYHINQYTFLLFYYSNNDDFFLYINIDILMVKAIVTPVAKSFQKSNLEFLELQYSDQTCVVDLE